jgi:hypothetical protein
MVTVPTPHRKSSAFVRNPTSSPRRRTSLFGQSLNPGLARLGAAGKKYKMLHMWDLNNVLVIDINRKNRNVDGMLLCPTL